MTPESNSDHLASKETSTSASVYVSYFNPFYIFRHPQYVPIQAGKASSGNNLQIFGDDSGDHISRKNFLYSELTVLYWVWKNAVKTRFVGFCHYRRFFDVYNEENYPRAYRAFAEDDEAAFEQIPEINFDQLLADCDMVLPVHVVMTHSLRRNYERNHYSEHYLELEKVINEDFPEYRDSFQVVMERTNRLPPYNMFLTRWECFDRYSSFLFAVLEKLEPRINLPTDQSQHRIFGYLSERLLAVFVRQHDLRVQEYPLFVFNRRAKKKSKLVYHVGNFIKNLNFRQKYIWRGAIESR